jgi:hypothetical protein
MIELPTIKIPTEKFDLMCDNIDCELCLFGEVCYKIHNDKGFKVTIEVE